MRLNNHVSLDLQVADLIQERITGSELFAETGC
jgi:hypothetical protein